MLHTQIPLFFVHPCPPFSSLHVPSIHTQTLLLIAAQTHHVQQLAIQNVKCVIIVSLNNAWDDDGIMING